MKSLVIEDEPETSRYICNGLREAGHVVRHCDNGLDGLHQAVQESWDLIIMDRLLPGGVDGLSMWFVVLTALITVVTIISAWEVITVRVAQYLAAFLILSGLMIGVFSTADGMLFYVFFEATLIPMYIIIGVWGGANRVYAAFKFFLYTLMGSLLMLIALLYLYTQTHTFDIAAWQAAKIGFTPQILLFIAFFLAFSVKVPMWPVHTWLPDAHVEAPTGGSVVLAAIMLKLGAYGFIRFSLPIAPDASHFLAPVVITLSLIAVIYIGFVALVQEDMKKLVAYSSIAHMGFVTLGFFIFSQLGMEVCVTLGEIGPVEARKLKAAGVTAYNHNIDTSPEFYPEIVSTHTFDDRLKTIAAVQESGMSVCCGGIIGMGESINDRLRMIEVLSELEPQPDSVPINCLMAMPGTPLAEQPPVDIFELVRLIAVARLALPKARVRLAAGRTRISREGQALCFFAGANSIFFGDKLLTAKNPEVDVDLALLRELGLEVETAPRHLASA